MHDAGPAETKVGGRFVLQRRLGAGSFGVVFQAVDRERNSVVALKSLRRTEPESVIRFKHEFRSLADVVHPNLVALYELLSDGDEWFFTMELVQGVDFLAHVRPGTFDAGRESSADHSTEQDLRAPLEPLRLPTVSLGSEEAGSIPVPAAPAASGSRARVDRLRAALRQLAHGLCALHDAGKLHRDIKPSNVLVTPDGRVKILDFGMVLEVGSTFERTTQIVGTPHYMSPEQAAALPLTPASDWYSAGILLYEALTARLPYQGTALDMLSLKLAGPPRRPSDLEAGLPADLDALCMELLQPEPPSRPTGREVLERLAAPPAERSLVSATSPSTPLVGRSNHLADLHGAFAATQHGRPVVVYVHGASGAGKSALLRRFAEEVQERAPGAVLLAGRCYHQESVPYEALDSVIDSLSQYLRALPEGEADAVAPLDGAALVRLFPTLRQVRAVANAPRKSEATSARELRRRAFGALRELLARLAHRRPLVLLIDDLQWGDLDSAALLQELLRPPDPPPLLLVAAYRSEDAATSPLLRVLLAPETARDCAADFRRLVVGELGAREARELAALLLGADASVPAGIAESIAHESGGNPFFIHELSHALAADPESPSLAATLPARLESVIEQRVARLPDGARRLLQVVSVAGYPLEREAAARAAGVDEAEPATLALLRSGRLVRTRSQAGKEHIESYHDRIRETVVAGMSVAERAEQHVSIAASLEALGTQDPERLAVHVLGAGDPARAARLFAQAGARAAESLAFGHAAGLYRQALALGSWDGAEARRLRIRLGEALGGAGRGAEAARAFLEAARGEARGESLELTRRAAEQLLRAGHVDEGLATLRTVLDAVGLRFPATPRAALFSLLLQRLRFRLRGLAFRERPAAELSAEVLIRIDVCWAAAIGLGFVDTIRGAVFQTRGLLLALEAGEPSRVSRALAVEAVYCSTDGGRSGRRTRRLTRASLELARRLDQPGALGLATVSAGIVAYFEGRWRDSRDTLERAESLMREQVAGAAFELDSAIYCRLFALYSLGEMRELARLLPDVLADAQERGDRYSLTNLRVRVAYLARLGWDDVEEAAGELSRAMEEWSHQGFHNQHWWHLLGRGQVHLYAGEGPAAWRLVSEGWPALTRTFVLRVQLISILARSLRGRAALAAAPGAERPEALLRVAESDAAAIEAERTSWAEPLARLLRAGAAARRGRIEPCVAELTRAEAGFERADMALHAAAARRRRGEVLAGDEGRRLVEEADAWMASQDIRNQVRMTAMLCW